MTASKPNERHTASAPGSAKPAAGLRVCPAGGGEAMPLPYADGGVKAGFPSPAQDYMTESIDLNDVLVRRRETTFYARVDGDSMVGAGIFDGDIVVIDKALEVRSGDYVVAYIDGEFTLKKFRLDDSGTCAWLVPANRRYKPIRVSAENDFSVWGVVTGVIRKLR